MGASHAGIYVGSNATCQSSSGHDSLAMDPLAYYPWLLNYTIVGSEVRVNCSSPNGLVHINSDKATCFLYGPTGLPAPPVLHFCNNSGPGESSPMQVITV